MEQPSKSTEVCYVVEQEDIEHEVPSDSFFRHGTDSSETKSQ